MTAISTAVAAVPATISATEAANVSWQAIVIGAGPAGAALAWRLAARGIRVLLIDRQALPRGKVCGCCLSPQAYHELRLLGAEAIPDDMLPLAAVRIAHRRRCVRLPLSAGGVVSRERLDAHLVGRAVAAGCHWLPSNRVVSVDDTAASAAATVTIDDAAGGTPLVLQAAVAAIAAGLADPVRIAAGVPAAAADVRRVAPRSRIGIGTVLDPTAADLPVGELVMAVGRAGYCGLVRLDDGRIDVAAAIDRAALASHADPARAVTALLAEAAGHVACMLPTADVIHAAAFRATPALTRRAPLVAGMAGRIFRLGDAAGYVEPFTGEGIGWALASARLLAHALVPAATAALQPSADAGARYSAAHRSHFAPRHARCRLVAVGLRHPAVVAVAFAAARGLPWAARRIVPAMIGAGFSGSLR